MQMVKNSFMVLAVAWFAILVLMPKQELYYTLEEALAKYEIALWLGKVLSLPYEALYYLSAMAFLTLLFGTMITKYDTISHSTPQDDASFSLSKYWAFWISIFLMQVGFGACLKIFSIIFFSTNGASTLKIKTSSTSNVSNMETIPTRGELSTRMSLITLHAK